MDEKARRGPMYAVGMAESGVERMRTKYLRRGASAKSVDQYTQFVGTVRRIAGKPLLKLTVRELEALDVRLLDSAAVYRTALKMFYRSNKKHNLMDALEPQHRPVKEISESDVLTPSEVMKLIRVCTSKRDRAIVAVLAATGGRIGEVLGLQVKRIAKVRGDGYQAEFVATKTKRNRYSPRIEGPFKEVLEDWLAAHPRRGDPEAWVFPSSVDLAKRIARGTVEELMRKLGKKAGLSKRCNPHGLRHGRVTWGMMNHEDGAALSQAVWGKPASTMLNRYSHFSGKETGPVEAERVDLPDVPPLPIPPVLSTQKQVGTLTDELQDLRARYASLERAVQIMGSKLALDAGIPAGVDIAVRIPATGRPVREVSVAEAAGEESGRRKGQAKASKP